MTDNAIVVEGIKKRYDEVIALDGVDLEVEAGTVFGLLGPNGAGKTTMVRVLATVLDPDEGRAQVLGYDVMKQADAVRRRIGLAGQYAAVDANLTGRENLQMVGVLSQMQNKEIAPRAAELLGAFDLTDAADRPVAHVFGRHAASPGHRGLAGPPSADPVPGRTDDRLGHHQPQRAVGHDPRPGRPRHDGAAHHAVPGGGRPARVAHRGGRRRQGDRQRHAGRAEGRPREHGGRDGDERRSGRRTAPWRSSPGTFEGRAESEGSLVRISSDQGAHALVEVLRALDARAPRADHPHRP